MNIDASWDVVKDLFNIETLVANNFVRDDSATSHFAIATGLTDIVQLMKTLEGFLEWDAFYPVATSIAASRRNAVGGLVYIVKPDFAMDIRAGVGLNGRSDDFLAGVGFSLRY